MFFTKNDSVMVYLKLFKNEISVKAVTSIPENKRLRPQAVSPPPVLVSLIRN